MSVTDEILVSVKGVSRFYGDLCAVNNLSFDIHRGEVLGLLGPNGAGKSTAIQMITGNLAPSFGQITINGIDILDRPKKAKQYLGYLPEHPPVYKEFTVDEYLNFCAKLHHIKHGERQEAINIAKQRCNLNEVGKRLIGNLSKGFQQRVGIAQAIIHSPPVVILDEPTVGLDPIQIREIRSLIRELGKEHCVILSTHILPEVTTTCDKVFIINRGSIVLTETTEDLQKRMQSSSLFVGFNQAPEVKELHKFAGVDSVEMKKDGYFRIHHNPDIDPSEKIVLKSVEQGWRLIEIRPEQLSLEDVFVDITTEEHNPVNNDNVAEVAIS